MAKRTKQSKSVEALTHEDAKRTNIPTAELESVMRKDEKTPIQVAYERRNQDLDPQLVWRGKDMQNWSDLVVQAPPLYIQEKVHPKVLIDDLKRETEKQATSHSAQATQTDLFSDFNGIPEGADKTEFYQHDANWTNRMILGDSLNVMASLAEREGLRGKVQCIYLDPPYGIKFNSNFQWSTTSRDVKDGKADHITREAEQVKAFRDTWRDGIHSYLSYLRDRLTVARELLSDSGSIFVQIGDENVHRVRALMDEVFGDENFCSQIAFVTTGGVKQNFLASRCDFLLWYNRDKSKSKFRQPYFKKNIEDGSAKTFNWIEFNGIKRRGLTAQEKRDKVIPADGKLYSPRDLTTQGNPIFSFEYRNKKYKRPWKTTQSGLERMGKSGRLHVAKNSISRVSYFDDFPASEITALWTDTFLGSFAEKKQYVVQTSQKTIQRCILMSTDPGDLVLDPTCGSGTTAYVAEQWGRRWITIDTSRVSLALARARIMGARYSYYLLSDSKDGQVKEAELSGKWPVVSGEKKAYEPPQATYHSIKHGFVYERVPHITLKSIANNAEIDVIWEKWQKKIAPLLDELGKVVGGEWLVDSGKQNTSHKSPATSHTMPEWEVPREKPADWPQATEPLITEFWKNRIARQKEIDASIAAKADYEYLYDKPYEDKKKVRVAGPFTVESLSPHRILAVDENDELIDEVREPRSEYGEAQDFGQMILENLRISGIQQAHKEDKINFTSLTPWPGDLICAEGVFEVTGEEWLVGSEKTKTSYKSQTTSHKTLRAGIFIGPEFGTVQREDLVKAARECGDADFDVLIACAFNYEAHTTELEKLGRIQILKARMNADLHMAADLKNTGAGNLFVIFGEPDVEVTSGLWVVDSKGRMVTNYDQFKELSGFGSLEEINQLGRTNLPELKKLAEGRVVWANQPASSRGSIRSGEHSGGSSEIGDGGVSTVSQHSERLPGRSRNAADPDQPSATSSAGKHKSSAADGARNKPNARWTEALASIKALKSDDFPLQLTTNHFAQVTIHGVDVFHPNTGEIISDNADGIACWFVDNDYNEESFFVRQAYFLGANDPYKALKTTLKAEINQEAWDSLHSDISRPFDKPKSGRIAVKVINHLGDEVMKVYRVD